MKPLYAILSALYIGVTFISCAGTDSSAKKKGEEAPNLFKAGTPVADSLFSRMPELAHSVFQKTLDSVPGEYYYHVTDDRIDTLFKKESGQYKPIVSIDYDFLIGQDSYDLEIGSHKYFVMDNTLKGEEEFPKWSKAYWDNGNIKVIATGILYKDDQGSTRLDSGHVEMYSENGKTLEKNNWKDKQVVAYKIWNENGTLIEELNLPHYYKEYHDDGTPQKVMTGILYRDDQDLIQVDSGREERYFESGKIQLQNDWKDKQFVAQKVWNENGTLIVEGEFPKQFKTYWDNGKLKGIATGILYKEDQNISVDSGYTESYFENGKIYQQNHWKDKQIVTQKEWDENGILIKEIDHPKYYKEYWDNGKPKAVLTGLLYRDKQGDFNLDSGRRENYFENGMILEQTDWKDKQPVASKAWNEKGVLVKDIVFPSHLKKYWDNGKPMETFTGLLYREDNPCLFSPDSGHGELYFENGKIKQKNDWKQKQVVSSKVWNEKGVLIKDIDFPKYIKENWDNGKPKGVMKGILYKDNRGVVLVDSGREEIYFENGKIKRINDWKDKQPITQKIWNEKGVLIQDVEFPRHLKEYWDNGRPKTIATGSFYRDEQDGFLLDSGHSEAYFENGKIKQQNDWKDKQPITHKEWNEKGVLIKEHDIQKYFKEYWDNGKIKEIGTGLLYRDGQSTIKVDSGHGEVYFENGQMKEQSDWKDKVPIKSKVWNEKGVLIKDIDFPKHFKEYWDNGNVKGIATGILYRDEQNIIKADSGHSETYHENGKIHQQNDWKGKLLVKQKEWNESGILVKDFVFPNYSKEYWDNGKLKMIMTGVFSRDGQGKLSLDSGHTEFYFENGKINEKNDRINKQFVTSKVWNEKGILIQDFVFPKYANYYWNDGKPRTIATGLLYRDGPVNFKVDSGHSELYFENGKIHQKNDWKDKQVFAQKKWNESGVLITDIDFPKYFKEYWDNGKPKEIITGFLYRDDQGIFRADSGYSEIYHENGKIKQKNEWRNKRFVTSKQWNENGVLTVELDFPKSYKEFWDNGKIKQMGTGLLYRDDQDNVRIDNGHGEIYFESGKIKQKVDWKNKRGVALKEWNEDGVLIKELNFPKYSKFYWDNGKPQTVTTGLLYWDNQGVLQADSGHTESYYENGKNQKKIDWKDKQVVAFKEWNENGVLIKDIDLTKHLKEYWDNGKIKEIGTGLLYRDDQNVVKVDNGHSEIYFENGKIKQKNEWKNKQLIAQKEWNENGTLTKDIKFPKHFKEYWDNGNPKLIMTGYIPMDEHGKFAVDSGHTEAYFENGKIKEQGDWLNKQTVAGKRWNEDGELILDFPKYYKEYWGNGNLKEILTGRLYIDDKGDFALDSGHQELYFENGKIKEQNDWKNKQIVASKLWNENGTLTGEFDITAGYLKNYGENGTIRLEVAGFKGYTEGEDFRIENGYLNRYYNNGKPEIQLRYQEEKIVGVKLWFEDGTLSAEGDVFRGFDKKYFPNGKLARELLGKFHYDGGSRILEKASEKSWNEDGNLIHEIVFPKYEKWYFDNGNLGSELEGTLYYDDQNKIQVQDGSKKDYYENGKARFHLIYRGKKIVSEKVWSENGAIEAEGDVSRKFHKGYFPNGKLSVEALGEFHYDGNTIVMENGTKKWWYENGNLEYELVFPKHERKYSDNGTLAYESEGTLYYDDQKEVQVQEGSRKEYSDNGKLTLHQIYKGKKLVGKTVWNENGTITISAELPNHYREFYDDGKIKAEATGTIVEEDDSFRIKDGTYKEYDLNGKVTYTATYEDFQRISEK